MTDEQQRVEQLEEILFSNEIPTEKVQRVIRLGYDEEVASEMVERVQTGNRLPLYYEVLGNFDYDSKDPD